MRVEILANDRASFVKPMADGLARMLKDCGADARVHYDGIAQMMRLQWAHTSRFPPGPNPYSLIGLNLDDGRLYPDQREEFQVLVDFEQPRDTSQNSARSRWKHSGFPA